MATEATGTVNEALRLGARLLRENAPLAALQAREILQASPGNADAFRLLGAALRRTGDDEEAERAELDAINASVRDPDLIRAAEALLDNELAVAEHVLRPRLKARPTDVAAIRMMAELAARLGRYVDSENLLRRALELAPAFAAARSNLATMLYKQNRLAEALAELARLEVDEGNDDAGRQNLKAAALGRLGSYEEAIDLYGQVLERQPGQPRVWMSLGHVLKTIGRRDDSIAAYRRAIDSRAGSRRGLVEPRQPQDRRLRRGRRDGDDPGPRNGRPVRRRSPPPPFRARQGARGPGRTGSQLHPLCRRQSDPSGDDRL